MRTAVVRLTQDVSQAVAANAQYAASADRTASVVERAGARQDKAWKLAETAGKRVAVGGALVLGAIGKANITFDKSMSNVNAATMETEANLGRLRKAAIDAGADTAYSAAEAADGITELAKAGVQTSDILGGALRGALDLAAAGQISVADAAEYTATALTQFQLKGNKAAHVADLLAAGAGKAQGEVADMALALNYAGVPSAQLGVSIEETAGTIALLAKNGLIGEKAGTALRGMLGSLTAPSKQAANLMGELGLEVFDAQGKFVGFDGVAGQLQKRMQGLTDDERAYYLGKIFGREQMQAANILLREGADGVRKWTRAVDDQGFAAENAQRKMDNLAGDWERFTGELDSAFLNGGGGLQDGLRDIVQGAEKAVGAFNDLPDSVQEGTVKAVAALTGAGGIVWALSKVRSGINGLRGGSALSQGVKLADAASAGRVVPVFVTNMGAGGLGGPNKPGSTTVAPVSTKATARSRAASVARGAAGVAAGVIGLDFVVQLAGGKGVTAELDDVTDSLKRTRSAGDEVSGGFTNIRASLEQSNVGKYAKDLGLDLNRLAADIAINGDRGEYLNGTLERLSDGGLKDAAAGLADFLTPGWDSRVKLAGRAVDDLGRISTAAGDKLKASGEKAAYLTVGLGAVTPQTQAYARVLRGMPRKVITEVAAKGTELTRRDVRRLSQEYRLTPRQVRTLMGLVGDGPTRQKLKTVQAQMAVTNALKAFPLIGQRGAEKARGDVKNVFSGVQTLGRAKATPRIAQQGAASAISQMTAVSRSLSALNGRTATTYIRTVRTGVVGNGGVATIGQAVADGGTIQGQRQPYGDKVLAYLAPGEEVITNRSGQADRFRADRAAGRIPAYADGGTVGPQRFADGGTVKATLTNGITIVFPAPAVTKAALVAAQGIAVASAQTARTAREQADADLEILRARQRINEIEKSLNERGQRKVKGRDGKAVKGKGGKAKTVSFLKLQGLDRDVAQAELAQAKRELDDLRGLQSEIDNLTEARKASTDAYSGNLDVFSRGASATGALNATNRFITEAATFGSVVARLKAAGASPALLRQVIAKGQSGDFRSATRLGEALLNQPLLLGQLNAALGVADQVSASLGQVSTDPRLVGVGGAFGNVGQTVVQRSEVAVSLQTLDPSLITGELSRLVKYEVGQVVSKLAG